MYFHYRFVTVYGVWCLAVSLVCMPVWGHAQRARLVTDYGRMLDTSCTFKSFRDYTLCPSEREEHRSVSCSLLRLPSTNVPPKWAWDIPDCLSLDAFTSQPLTYSFVVSLFLCPGLTIALCPSLCLCLSVFPSVSLFYSVSLSLWLLAFLFSTFVYFFFSSVQSIMIYSSYTPFIFQHFLSSFLNCMFCPASLFLNTPCKALCLWRAWQESERHSLRDR